MGPPAARLCRGSATSSYAARLAAVSALTRPAGGQPVIDVRGLVKSFGRFRALDGFDLRAEREICSTNWPASSSKTTLLSLR